MALYDRNGNEITVGAELSSSEIKKALISAVNDGSVNLGSNIGATLTTTFGNIYGETAYANMLTAYKKNPNSCIPFFISTDQHGGGLQQHRWVNNIDVDGVNIANINLGDTVVNSYADADMEDFYSQTWQVKNYIGVVGNHEYAYTLYDLSDFGVSRAFCTTNFHRRLNPSNENCYTVLDKLHNVKYIVLEEYIVNADCKGYTAGYTTKTLEWLIHELSVNDGFDIVILKHWHITPSDGTSYVSRDGTALSGSSAGRVPELSTMLANRKNKLSGTITDIDGNAHSYNFIECDTNLYCCLHGHAHAEVYAYKDGLLCYCADWFGNNKSCVFGLIDRKNDVLRIYKFDSTQVYDEFVIDLNI